MKVTLSTRVSMPEQVLKRELGNEAVILNVDSEKYYSLNEVGTRMLNILLENGHVHKALEALKSEYDADPEILQQDFLNLVEKLHEQGIIETTEV